MFNHHFLFFSFMAAMCNSKPIRDRVRTVENLGQAPMRVVRETLIGSDVFPLKLKKRIIPSECVFLFSRQKYSAQQNKEKTYAPVIGARHAHNNSKTASIHLLLHYY